jgi:hypothetical protein
VTGRPPSANGASSFHLGWVDTLPAHAVSVTLEILEPPRVPRLYFWALQADMAGSAGRAGGAHLGLQWHVGHPGSTAVNWGGYRSDGVELDGSASVLPSATGNPNTRNLDWSPGRPYRLMVHRVDEAAPDGLVAWRGTVVDLSSGLVTDVRDLYLPGDRIIAATMWSEVFAACDDPSVAVRWSDPTVHADRGDVAVTRVAVNYQTHQAGGCANTDSSVDPRGLVQRTTTARLTPQGTQLAVPRASS